MELHYSTVRALAQARAFEHVTNGVRVCFSREEYMMILASEKFQWKCEDIILSLRSSFLWIIHSLDLLNLSADIYTRKKIFEFHHPK